MVKLITFQKLVNTLSAVEKLHDYNKSGISISILVILSNLFTID